MGTTRPLAAFGRALDTARDNPRTSASIAAAVAGVGLIFVVISTNRASIAQVASAFLHLSTLGRQPSW